jgi:outer membrane receptor protein involved in Fe transport
LAVAAAALLAASGAGAQDAQTSVLKYDASFFADQRPNTAYDMVKRLPGFNFDDGASARGFAGTAGNVLVDSQRPTSKTDDLQSILQRIPASDVERIELIRGGAAGIDMQGQTVVANVIRKTADSTNVVAMFEDNLFKDGHNVPGASLQITKHAGASTFEGALTMYPNFDDSVGHGTRDVFDPSGAPVTHDFVTSRAEADGLSLHGGATIPLWSGTFKANLTLQNNPFRDSLQYDAPGFSERFTDLNVAHKGELGVNWNGAVGGVNLETLFLQRLGYFVTIDTANDGTTFDFFRSKQHTGESIFRTTVRYLPMPSLTLETGAEGAYNFLDGHVFFAENGVPIALPSANARVSEKRGEVFAQGTWKASDAWMLELGARFEFSNIGETGDTSKSRSFSYPKPRAVVTWAPSADTQIRARYEKVVGQLDFNNFIATADLSSTGTTGGNPDLRPDQRTQYELSFEQHFWDKGAIVVSLLHEQIKDVVDLVPVLDTTTSTYFDAPGNIGDGRNDQIDVELTLPLDRLGIDGGRLKSSTTWRKSAVKDPTTGAKRVISGERPQNIQVGFSQDLARWNSTWGIDWYNCWDEYYYRLALVQHKKVVPPLLDIYWEYKPTTDWSIHLELDNFVPFLFRRTQFEYTGPRNTSPLNEVEVLNLQSQPRIYFQIRKTFD